VHTKVSGRVQGGIKRKATDDTSTVATTTEKLGKDHWLRFNDVVGGDMYY